jgi:hypothetical protein
MTETARVESRRLAGLIDLLPPWIDPPGAQSVRFAGTASLPCQTYQANGL